MAASAYSDTLDYLFSQLPMYQRVGAVAVKKDLGNIRLLSEALGHPQRSFPSVHIAGTNGKGSVLHFLAAMLQRAGYRVGCYTSPHYKDFRERVKIDGRFIDEEAVVRFVSRHKGSFEDIRPSFFEWSVALAFDHFRQGGVDLALVETGLGGRLDSTNILQPLLSVITHISWDHQQFLGDTLAEIAGEKAGIIKGQTPVVLAPNLDPEAEAVLRRAAALQQAPIVAMPYEVRLLRSDLLSSSFEIQYRNAEVTNELILPASGRHQVQNLSTALNAVEALTDRFPVSPALRLEGLTQVRESTYFIGRRVLVSEAAPRVIADSAHNIAGMQALASDSENTPYGTLRIVFGSVQDKEVRELLELLPEDAVYYLARPSVPRGLETGALLQVCRDLGLESQECSSPTEALAIAVRDSMPEDLVLITGSIFLVAELI